MKNYTLVLLHGWGQKHESMSCLEENLNNYFKVLNIDLLKISKDRVYDFDDYLSDLHYKIKNEKHIIIIGHSFGGKIASLYALKYPVEKIILIAPSTYIKKTFKTKLKILINKSFKLLKIKKFKNYFSSNDYKKLQGKEQMTFKNIIKNIDKNDLKNMDLPTLLIGFKNDKQVPLYNLKKLETILPNAKLITYEGEHFSYIENCENVILNIMDFIYA